MHEDADILSYNGGVLWIKHINGNLYCVNGKFFAFSDECDVSDSKFLFDMLSVFDNPEYAHIDRPYYLLVVTRNSSSSGEYDIRLANLNAGEYDIISPMLVLSEYLAWRRENFQYAV